MPSLGNKMSELHHEILSIVLTEITRSEIYNTVSSMDDLKEELSKQGYNLKQTTP